MNYPRISIVTPSYNQGKYIEETILSVLEQNYPNLQYIIIDGGSDDESIKIIKKYAKHLDYWVSEKDNGQSDAINKGFMKCNGQIFNWLCSDDYYEKDTLMTVANAYQDSKAKVICGKIRYIYEEDGSCKEFKGTQVYNNISECIGRSINIQPSTFFDKKKLEKIFPLNSSLHYAMDQEFWIRYLMVFRNHDIVSIDKVLTNFRMHGYSKTATLYPKFKQDEYSIFNALASRIDATEEQMILNSLSTENHINYSGTDCTLEDAEILDGIKYYLLNRNNLKFYIKNLNYVMKNISYCDANHLIRNSRIFKSFFGQPETL